MPRYFFHIVNASRHEDPTGIDLPDLESARREAVKDIEDISRQSFELIDIESRATWSIEICDEHDAVLLIVPFSVN